jgi:nucleotidyltransferase substrate binding protein (TIGR01987 family)
MAKQDTKLMNFNRALTRLKEAVEEFRQNDSDVVRDGLIQRFEFTYELAWKSTKEVLEEIGIIDKNSPKTVIKEAYAQEMIVNENNWLLMLKDRNTTSHIYKEELAKEIADRIADYYVQEFDSLLAALTETQK